MIYEIRKKNNIATTFYAGNHKIVLQYENQLIQNIIAWLIRIFKLASVIFLGYCRRISYTLYKWYDKNNIFVFQQANQQMRTDT
jgi:hypothetical protein